VSDEKDREDEAKKAETTSETSEDDKAEAGEGETETEAELDAAHPEVIARRVAALTGDEDEIERIARMEEQKLAERRSAQKKGKKKSGLEVAASKKLQKIGKRAEPRREIAVAADADPLIERTAKLSEWAKKNQKLVQIVGGAVAAGLLGLAGFLYMDHKHEIEASVLLTKAVADERARIGEPPKDEEDSDGSPVYKTYEARREAALATYREVETKFPKTGAAILARLSEASLLLDKRDVDGALRAFEDVNNSALAAADQEVKGRTLEGLGFAHELAAEKGDKDKNLDLALKVYKELENTVDVKGFKELAMYHQARVLLQKGDKDKAKEILITLRERLNKPEENVTQLPLGPAFPYLSEVAMDRLREIDPSAAPKGQRTAPGGNPQLSPAQIRKMIEEAQKKGAAGEHGGH
jgi:tetratricopeptide (TPR) repeat protein